MVSQTLIISNFLCEQHNGIKYLRISIYTIIINLCLQGILFVTLNTAVKTLMNIHSIFVFYNCYFYTCLFLMDLHLFQNFCCAFQSFQRKVTTSFDHQQVLELCQKFYSILFNPITKLKYKNIFTLMIPWFITLSMIKKSTVLSIICNCISNSTT